MIKVESPFKLLEPPPHPLGGRLRPTLFREPRTRELLLRGALVSLETAGKIYDLATRQASPDNGLRTHGFAWSRDVVSLAGGGAIEQQIFRAHGGNTVVFSWRVLGPVAETVRLTATPVFSANDALTRSPFAFEPETNGGRLTWQPFPRATRIIADTNGRCTTAEARAGFAAGPTLALPSIFEFTLGTRPSLLILSVESPENARVDPLLGGFLAAVAESRPCASGDEYLPHLAAA